MQAIPRSKYVIVTPARNEAKFLEPMIESIARQTLVPAEWIIVDDGSTDGTAEIIDRFARQHPWIRGVHRENRGFRKAGGGVVEAFYDGFMALTCSDWEFVVKLDADLTLEETYFERCLEYFRQEPRLGIAGGTVYHPLDGRLKPERTPQFHVRGASKIYRRDCWDAIGGLWPAPGWDTIDEVRANMLGWTTQSFSDIPIIHHRMTGTAEGSWRGLMKNGQANYIAGYHPLYLTVACVSGVSRQPYLIGAWARLYGFFSSYFKRAPRVNDPALITYVQRQQLRRLFGMDTIWK